MNIRAIGSKEAKRFDSLLGDYHYLGETRPVGDTMRMVAEIDGEWVGLSKGYSRHRADVYVPNDRPKTIWVRELRTDAVETLRAMELPEECRAGARSDADGVLPRSVAQVDSLYEMKHRRGSG